MFDEKRKYNQYTTEFKEKIVNEYFSGQGGTKFLAKKYGIPYHSIDNWIQKRKKNIDLATDNRGKKSTGRPKASDLTIEDYKERYEILKKYQAFLEARHGKK